MKNQLLQTCKIQLRKMRKRIAYDRTAAGERLQKCRAQFRWSRKDVAQRCGLTEKYYSDIERGYCGMSVETLISLSELYGLTLDYLIRGEEMGTLNASMKEVFLANLGKLPPEKQNCCLQMLFLFMEGTAAGTGKGEPEEEYVHDGQTEAGRIH